MTERTLLLHQRYARADAYTKLTPEERADVDAVMNRVLSLRIQRIWPDAACEIVAAIGELLAAGRAEP